MKKRYFQLQNISTLFHSFNSFDSLHFQSWIVILSLLWKRNNIIDCSLFLFSNLMIITYPMGISLVFWFWHKIVKKDSSRCKDCIIFYFRINEQLNENIMYLFRYNFDRWRKARTWRNPVFPTPNPPALFVDIRRSNILVNPNSGLYIYFLSFYCISLISIPLE